MRTNTQTFRSRITAELRALGLNVSKAKAAAAAIVNNAREWGYPVLSDTSKARISFDSADCQSVYMDDDGIARFHVTVAAKFQPLVNTEATAEQQAISDEMGDMLVDLYEAEGDEKARLLQVYEAKLAQILAINPNVHAGIADPDKFEFYHNIHKEVFGFRPRGFLNYDGLVREVASLIRSSEMDQAA